MLQNFLGRYIHFDEIKYCFDTNINFFYFNIYMGLAKDPP